MRTSRKLKLILLSFLVISFAFTGCQSIGTSQIDLNKMIMSQYEVKNSMEVKETITIDLDYDEEMVDEDELVFWQLFDNMKIDLHMKKNGNESSIDGTVYLTKGEIPFQIAVTEVSLLNDNEEVVGTTEQMLITIDNGTKPFVVSNEEVSQMYYPYDISLSQLYNGGLDDNSMKLVDFVVRNLPNVSDLSYSLHTRTEINDQNVYLNKVEAKVTGEELPALIVGFLENMKTDESLKEIIKVLMVQYEIGLTPEEEEAMVEELYQEALMYANQGIAMINQMEDLGQWPLDNQSFMETVFYLDHSMNINKAENTITFKVPEMYQANFGSFLGFTTNISYEYFNINEEVTVEPIEVNDTGILTSYSSDDEVIESLNKDGVLYEILLNDFKVIPVKTLILTLDQEEMDINYEGKGKTQKTLDVAPYAKDGRTLVPVRFVSENLGADVDWNTKTQEVTIMKGNKVVVLTLGSEIATIDGIEVLLDAKPEASNGRTMVPLRFISEAFEADVDWDDLTKGITIKQYK